MWTSADDEAGKAMDRLKEISKAGIKMPPSDGHSYHWEDGVGWVQGPIAWGYKQKDTIEDMLRVQAANDAQALVEPNPDEHTPVRVPVPAKSSSKPKRKSPTFVDGSSMQGLP
jgi:hypothetical protein